MIQQQLIREHPHQRACSSIREHYRNISFVTIIRKLIYRLDTQEYPLFVWKESYKYKALENMLPGIIRILCKIIYMVTTYIPMPWTISFQTSWRPRSSSSIYLISTVLFIETLITSSVSPGHNVFSISVKLVWWMTIELSWAVNNIFIVITDHICL